MSAQGKHNTAVSLVHAYTFPFLVLLIFRAYALLGRTRLSAILLSIFAVVSSREFHLSGQLMGLGLDRLRNRIYLACLTSSPSLKSVLLSEC